MGLDEKPEIVALNKVDAIPEKELAKKKAALEKACGHKVQVISGVTGEGITTVLRAMMKNIQDRRAERIMARERHRPARAPVTRAERQTVNFNAPVVPKSMAAELNLDVKVKSARPVIVPKKKKAEKAEKPAREPLKKKKVVKGGGRAKAKPKATRHSAKARANKASLNKTRSRR
jgi:50S ribosomal subunit-associated GTPase HflX